MTGFFWEPLETFLFKDARPFDAGEFRRAAGIGVLPAATSVMGFLRNWLLASAGHSYERFKLQPPSGGVAELLGTNHAEHRALGTLSVRGPWLTLRSPTDVRPLLPMPADVLSPLDSGCIYLAPEPGSASKSNIPDGLLPLAAFQAARVGELLRFRRRLPNDAPDPEGLWIVADERGLLEYLCQKPQLTTLRLSEWLHTEPRTGIQRVRQTFTVAEGKLYTAEFLRALSPAAQSGWRLGFSADCCTPSAFPFPLSPEPVTLGAERRAFRFESLEHSAFPAVPPQTLTAFIAGNCVHEGTLHLRLLLTSPGHFQSGWHPDAKFAEELADKGLGTWDVVAAALPRPITVSGWDLAGKEPGPRAATRVVATGGVYFVRGSLHGEEWNEKTVDAVLNFFWLRTLSAREDERKMGYSCVLPGGWIHAR